MRLVVSAQAGRDLEGIYDFTAERWGVAQADNYADSFENAFDALCGNTGPVTGKSGYRRLRNGSHFIFYRVGREEVYIERVLHERMDPPRHLR